MKKAINWIIGKLYNVSTKPEKSSYIWARRTRSLLATSVLWIIWAARLLSAYQWVKAIYRWLGSAFKFGYVENDSGRPDIPPKLGEIYFCLFTILFSVAHHFNIKSPILMGICYYYIFESGLWVVYYTVFRRFFELGYTIYHRLEYILTIALIIPTQALCFAHIYSMSFKDAFTSLLGASSHSTPSILILFSFFLRAIVIGIIISTFPTESIKKSIKKSKMIVIGCGDVVKSRLYPSLKNSEYSVSVSNYDIAKNKNVLPNCTVCDDMQALKQEYSKSMNSNSIVWVATPPDSHFEYTEHAIKSGAEMVVVEKPIANNIADIEAFERMALNSAKRKKLFFLSYYILEKALPLTYIASISKKDEARIKFYKKYLDISGEPLVLCWKEFLGDLKSITIHIFEGEDNRAWVSDNKLGGHLFETFLHNLLIAMQFCGPAVEYNKAEEKVEEIWKNINFKNADYTQNVYEISLQAEAGDTKIDLIMQKNSPRKTRTAQLLFENGEIVANFDTKSVEISFTHLKTKSTIRVKDEFSKNYSILVDMVGRVYSKEVLSEKVDGFENQLVVLRWLNELNNK